MFGFVATAVAAAVVAALVPDEPQRQTCQGRAWDHARRPVEAPLALSAAAVPHPVVASQGATWMLTLTNRTRTPRHLSFSNGAFAEVELWRGGECRYSWYSRHGFTQAMWGYDIPAGSTVTRRLPDRRPLGVEPGRYTLVAFVRNNGGPAGWDSSAIVVR